MFSPQSPVKITAGSRLNVSGDWLDQYSFLFRFQFIESYTIIVNTVQVN